MPPKGQSKSAAAKHGAAAPTTTATGAPGNPKDGYLPKCYLWTPYLHDEFPPKSKPCRDPIPPPASAPSTASSSTAAMSAASASSGKRQRPWSLLTLLGGDDRDDEADAQKRFRQNDEDRKDETQGQKTSQEKKVEVKAVEAVCWDFQYQPKWSVEGAGVGAGVAEAGDFGDLAVLLDGANLIYCLNANQLFGLLRASVGDVTDLGSYTWAPHTDIDDPTMEAQNPLRPKPDDPYYRFMSPTLSFPVPSRLQAEAITRPTLVLPADPDWTPTRPPVAPETPERPSTPDPSNGSASASASAGASEYNADDTKEDVLRYLSSKRWMGSSSVRKEAQPDGPYFRDARMIYWMFKCLSVCGDLKLDDLSLKDICAWNKHMPWWNSPEVRLARRHSHPKRDTTSDSSDLPDQARYTLMHNQKRWDAIKDALEAEVRLTADVLTMLHHHKLPLTCYLKRWSQKDRRSTMRWELLSVRTSTPSLLEYTSTATPDPTAPPSNASADGAKAKKAPLKPRRGSRLAAMPKPILRIGADQFQRGLKNKTYNVVCSVAISNLRRNYLDGEWCDLMYYQNQHISMIACLVISAQHPTGTVRYFIPNAAQLRAVNLPPSVPPLPIK